MEHKYLLLRNILDKLRKEAPASYTTYLPDEIDIEELNKARSLAYIHLLLKVKFGISDFKERHKLITDGTYDGGIDAYYFDKDRKKLYLIQSKFRTTVANFSSKTLTADDIIKMEIGRITKGESHDSNGNEFNPKIKNLQQEIRNIRDIAKYDYIVLFLGNLNRINDDQIRRLIDNAEYEIFDHEKSYNNLIFPLSTGTHFDPEEIIITLELENKEHPKLKQTIDTSFGKYNLTAIFIPTIEIGKMMSKYKNAILKYNPRNFLSLKKNSVNEKIKSSIVEGDKNNFALLNNGITILSSTISLKESTGTVNEGQLILTRPQILNGGQTAYTLSTIFDEYSNKPENPLKDKEVLVRIITPIVEQAKIDTSFIELISNATNQQNEVSEADRRSNHSIQMELQDKIFKNFGYLYERKAGEFYDGIKENFIDPTLVIKRLNFIKAYRAYIGEPAAARRTSEKELFKEDNFLGLLKHTHKYKEMFFSYILYQKLENKENSFRKKSDSVEYYGYSLMYGKWAVISSISVLNPSLPDEPKELFAYADKALEDKLVIWHSFDEFVKQKNKDTKYFKDESNFDLYYKVNLLDEDIKEYFLK